MKLIPSKLTMAMNAALFIAYNGREDKPVSGASIVEYFGLKERALEPVLQKLSSAGIIVSIKGPKGGYFVKDTEQTTLKDIVRAFIKAPVPANDTFGTYGDILAGRIRHSLDCWMDALSEITLKDLCAQAESRDLPTLETPPVLDFVV